MTKCELKTMSGNRLTSKVQEVTVHIIPRCHRREELVLLWQPASLLLTRHKRERKRGRTKITLFVKTNIDSAEGGEIDVIKERGN